MPRPNERKYCGFGWLRGIRTTYDKVPSTSETAVQTERSAMRILQKPRPKVMPEEMMAQHYSDPDYRARVAAAKLMNILWAKEPSQVHLDQSLYGAAFVLPQIARSAGWPKELTVLVLKTFLVLFVNYFVQFAVLYFIATEDMVWDLFSGQMYLCNFGKDAPSCPDGPNCIGPGGTVFTDSRYYSWDQWSVRIFARDAMKALFPDERADISRYADPGEYGVESNTCRFVCCGLYVVTVLDDLIGSYNLFKLMNSIESKDDLWIDWEAPGKAWASKEHEKTVMNHEEMDFVTLKIAGMPFHWKVLNYLLILLPKICLWKVTAEAGVVFLMDTQGIEDLVVNSVALAFILQIDELMCHEFINEKVHQLLSKLEVHMIGEVDWVDEVERMSDQELFEKNQRDIVESWSMRDLWRLVPGKLILCLLITWFFVMRYYTIYCMQNEAGGMVCKPLGLPKASKLSLPNAYLTSFFPPPREEKFFWSMPNVPRDEH